MCKKSITGPRKQAPKTRASPTSSSSSEVVFARRSRTKTRKPKYLSLKLQLSHPKNNNNNKKPSKKKMPQQQEKQELIDLFPLRAENNNSNLVLQDKGSMLLLQDDHHHQDVASLFETATDDSSTTLHSLLDTTTTTTTTTSDEVAGGGGGGPLSPPSYSISYANAMRCKERDASEERWVSYSEVIVKKEQEEVMSRCSCSRYVADAWKMMQVQGTDGDLDHDHDHQVNIGTKGLVGLKLDYQQILNAWSDKGPLYVQGGGDQGPQIVPDLLHPSNGIFEGNLGNLWTVPEIGGMKVQEKVGQREASVLRYKEKRQSRLFSKKIRYEVRKLNAEKRPRLKGRFVKRSGEE